MKKTIKMVLLGCIAILGTVLLNSFTLSPAPVAAISSPVIQHPEVNFLTIAGLEQNTKAPYSTLKSMVSSSTKFCMVYVNDRGSAYNEPVDTASMIVIWTAYPSQLPRPIGNYHHLGTYIRSGVSSSFANLTSWSGPTGETIYKLQE